jgi:hypothetical protein
MANNFLEKVKEIIKENSVSTALGNPIEMVYDPNDITNDDSYQKGDMRKPVLLGSKVIKRTLPKDLITVGKKKKKKK